MLAAHAVIYISPEEQTAVNHLIFRVPCRRIFKTGLVLLDLWSWPSCSVWCPRASAWIGAEPKPSWRRQSRRLANASTAGR